LLSLCLYHSYGPTTLRVRVRNFDAALFLYDGYDWIRTRRTIENEVKEMRKRLAKIRQLVASGQTQDPSIEDTSALLFNSVHIGLEESHEELEPGALIAAIDEELMDDFDGSSQSSWQSLKPGMSKKSPKSSSSRPHKRQLFRSKTHNMEFRITGLDAEVDRYRPGESLVSRVFATVRDVDIYDHIKTSTWRKFLTALRADSHGNIRESGSNMLRVELLGVYPVPGQVTEEARLKV
jgi:autophagy-related protein 2